jgi:hypothetical protein
MITQPAPVEAPASRLSGRRRALVWALVVLASLIGLGSILTTWVHRQMLDEQAWRQASTELIQNERVREALSVYLVNELYDNVDVSAALAQELPAALRGLAPTAAGALRQPATDAVDRLLDAPHVQQLFVDASSQAQSRLVNVLENKTGDGISTGSGTVTLDLGEVVQQLGSDIGLSASALSRIPADAGVITVMRSDQLSAAQTAVRAVRVLSTMLLVLVLGLYALAIYLAHGARRQTLRNIGWAVVLVGLIVLLVRRVGGHVTVEALTTPATSATGHQVWLIGTGILGDIGWAVILYGGIALLGALLAGPSGPALAVRRRVAPVLNDQPGLAWVIVAAVFLLAILWGGTHALRTLWGVALLGALLAAGVLAFRHQTLREAREI